MVSSDVSQRQGMIGGSDIGAVLDLPPYGCARRLFYKKTGVPEDQKFSMSGAIEIGIAMEGYVARKVEDLKGWKLIKRGVKAGEGPAVVHIDREIQKARNTPGVAEIKIVGDQSFWSFVRGGVPVQYILQLQWGMGIWDRTWGAVIVWNRDAGGLPYIFEFEYDHVLAEQVRLKVAKFWQMVESGTPPPVLDPRDSRCDGCEYGALCREQEWENVADSGLVQIDIPALDRWRNLKQIAKEAEESADQLRSEIEAAIGNNETVLVGTTKLTFRPQESWRIDTDRLKKEYPDLAKELQYRSLSRPLRVSQIKEKK